MTYVLVLAGRPGALNAALAEAARASVRGGETRFLAEAEAAEFFLPASIAAPDLPAALAPVRAALAGAPVDVLATRHRGRRRGLLVADMDSTIVEGETLDALAAHAGVGEAVASITARSMAGEIDFAEALRQRVAMLRGLAVGALEESWRATRLVPGARTLVATMRAHGAFTALVTGGFAWFAERAAASCGFDAWRANRLVIAGDALTGTVDEPILGLDAKREALLAFRAARGLRPPATLAVGDGANDLAMLGEAGLGVAFRARPVVTAAVTNRIEHADLRALLFLQGYERHQFVECG